MHILADHEIGRLHKVRQGAGEQPPCLSIGLLDHLCAYGSTLFMVGTFLTGLAIKL